MSRAFEWAMIALVAGLVAALIFAGCASPGPQTVVLNLRDSKSPVARYYKDGNQICSAVAVGPRTVLTAQHCTELGGKITVAMDGMPQHEVAVVATHPTLDFSALTLKDDIEPPYADVGAPPLEYDPVLFVGYGCALRPGGTLGRLETRTGLYLRRGSPPLPTEFPDLLSAGVVCHGDSGGALFDGERRLIGILCAAGLTDEGIPLVRAVDVHAYAE